MLHPPGPRPPLRRLRLAPRPLPRAARGGVALAVAALLAASGCTTPPTDPPSTAAPTTPPVAGSAAACVGDRAAITARADDQSTEAMPADLAVRLDAAAAETFGEVEPWAPGILVGVRSPEGTWTAAYGVADLATGAAATPDMTARVASVTKSFVGTVILQLVEEGRLSLDDPIDRWVPDVPNGTRITLRQLLTMTSGLDNYSDTAEWGLAVTADPTAAWTPQQLLGIAWSMPRSFAPGSDMQYSNTNFVLLGLVIEQVTGDSLADVIDERLLEPLELTGTAYPAGAELPSPRLAGYTVEALLAPTPDPSSAWVDATDWDPSSAGAAGAMTSTVDDLLTWSRIVATGQGVLSPETQVERLDVASAHLSAGEFYGQAIVCRDGWIGHDGNISGYNTMMRYDPMTDTSIVVIASGLDATGTPPRVIVAPLLLSPLADVVGRPFRPTAVAESAQVQGLIPVFEPTGP